MVRGGERDGRWGGGRARLEARERGEGARCGPWGLVGSVRDGGGKGKGTN